MDPHEDYDSKLKGDEARKKNFYNRVTRQVTLDDGTKISVMLYALNRKSEKYNSENIEKLGLVPEGNWLKFIKERKEQWRELKMH